MESYLTVTESNLPSLAALGLAEEVGEELLCEVLYDGHGADPSVGIMEGYAEITAIECDGINVEHCFSIDDMQQLHEQASQEMYDREQGY